MLEATVDRVEHRFCWTSGHCPSFLVQRLSTSDSDDLWEYILRIYAVFIFRSILRLKVWL